MKKYIIMFFVLFFLITPLTAYSVWIIKDAESVIDPGVKNDDGLKNYIDTTSETFDYKQHLPSINILGKTPTFTYFYNDNGEYKEVTKTDLINAGSYKIKVSNDTYGTTTVDYTILSRDISECNITFGTNSDNKIEYNTGIIYYVKYKNIEVDESNYTISYYNSLNEVVDKPSTLGTYTAKIEGSGNFKGSTSVTFEIINLLHINITKSVEYEYDGLEHLPPTDMYKVYDSLGNTIDDATVTFKFDNDINPQDAGTYYFDSVTLEKEGYESISYNISYEANTIKINPKKISVTWGETSFTYNGSAQEPTATLSSDYSSILNVVVDGAKKDTGEYSAKASLTSKDTNVIASNYEISNNTCDFKINKKNLYISTTEVSLSYDSSKRTFSSIKNDIINNIKFSGLISGDSAGLSVDEINDGTFIYTNDSVEFVDSLDSLKRTGLTTSYSYLIGSTYLLTSSITNLNYELKNPSSCILKYKTAKIGSTYYTIEDALNASGNITLAGNQSNTAFVYTAFSNLYDLTNKPYESMTYTLSGSRQLIVPYTSSTTAYTTQKQTTSSYVYSSLYVCKDIIINVSGSAHIDVGGLIGFDGNSTTTQVCDHGVLINEGNLNFETGTSLNSYGYTKGLGTIKMKNGSNCDVLFQQYDWPGGTAASEFYSKALITNAWSINNVLCEIYIYSGATYKINYYAWVSSGTFELKTDAYIIGNTSTSNCMFKPSVINDSTYILLKGKKANAWTTSSDNYKAMYLVEGSNQTIGIRMNLSFAGKYEDSTLKFSMTYLLVITVSFQTSTSVALTVGLMDVTLLENADVTFSKSSYLFLPGSKLEVNEGAKLNLSTGVNVTFAKYASLPSGTKAYQNYIVDKDDSYCINNGEINSLGSMGGLIKTTVDNATLTLSSVKTTYTIFYTTNDPYYTSISDNSLTGVDGSSGNFEAGSSYVSTNGTWTKGSVYEFTINYYDSDKSTLLNTLTVKQSSSDTYTVTGNEYTGSKTYYDFVKWTLNDGNDISGTTINADGSINLYAVWSEHKYEISYKTMYNEELVDATNNNKTKFTISDLDFSLSDASYESKYFDGWYVGIDKSSGLKISKMTKSYLDLFIESYGENQAIPLYAEFTDVTQYSISFEAHDSIYPDIIPNIDSIFVLEGKNATISLTNSQLSNLTKYDNITSRMYYFDGFVNKATGEVIENYTISNVTSDIVLVPNWTLKLSITYNYGTDLNVTLGKYSSKPTVTYYYVYGSEANVYLSGDDTGHTFVNWSNGSSTYTEITTSTFSSDVTLTANYTVNTYTLTISGTGNQTVTVKINGTQKFSGTSGNNTAVTFNYGDKISISFDKRSGNFFTGYKYTQVVLKGDTSEVTKKNGSSGISYEGYLTDCCNYTLEISKG